MPHFINNIKAFLSKSFKTTLGVGSIILGLTALLIPILPTSPFLLFGLAIIAPKQTTKTVNYFKKKWHAISTKKGLRQKQSRERLLDAVEPQATDPL